MTIVKICGFREVNDALIAAESGADYLGLVFVPSAGRCLDLDEAEHLLSEFRRQVTTEPTPQWIGLFGDQPVEEVVAITSKLRLDGGQLCGSEGMGYCGQMTVPVFKVITIDANVPAHWLEITGTKGTYTFDVNTYELIQTKGRKVVRTRGRNPEGEWWQYYGNIADHLTRGTPLVITPEWSRRPIHVLDLAVRSAKAGKSLRAKYA